MSKLKMDCPEAPTIFSFRMKITRFFMLRAPLAAKINLYENAFNNLLKMVCFRVNFESETRQKPTFI
jgi:hypothetical protein